MIHPTMLIGRGDACNVTALTMSAHAGTHVDAPRHYSDDGIGVDRLSLDVLVGAARLIALEVTDWITPALLQAALGEAAPERLLIRTPASQTPDTEWQPNYAAFTPEAADWLGSRGVRLVGVDTPSVDPATSKSLTAHKAFLRHNVVILESLCLKDVPLGEYELIALPLRIADNDAAPARVILRKRA